MDTKLLESSMQQGAFKPEALPVQGGRILKSEASQGSWSTRDPASSQRGGQGWLPTRGVFSGSVFSLSSNKGSLCSPG